MKRTTFFPGIAATLGIISLLAGPLSAYAATAVYISAPEPGTTIATYSTVTFDVTTSGFTNPTYALFDSYIGGSIESSDLNQDGQFSWTPLQNDVGTHTLTVNVSDQDGDLGSANITFVVTRSGTVTATAPAPAVTPAAAQVSIESIVPSTSVMAGQMLSFIADTSGFSGTPTYTLTDSFSGSTIAESDINASGAFSWTPSAGDVGTHTIGLTAEDGSGNSAQTSVTIVVTAAPVAAAAASPAAPVFTEYLVPGSQDDQVTALQQVLTTQGDFSGPVTGYFGTLTENAVIAFQAANGLDQLGVVGPATRAALNALESAGASATATAPAVAPTAGTAAGATATLQQIESEVQSLNAVLTAIEAQLAALAGQ